jgi:ABC-type antimicrobial peptide transport system permease subunit
VRNRANSYQPIDQEGWNGRLFVQTQHDPYALIPTITRTIRDMAGDQPVERASTLGDIRAEVLTPNRLNAVVFGGFAAVALLISVVGVDGVLAFSVSGRTHEFGIRMAMELSQAAFSPTFLLRVWLSRASEWPQGWWLAWPLHT